MEDVRTEEPPASGRETNALGVAGFVLGVVTVGMTLALTVGIAAEPDSVAYVKDRAEDGRIVEGMMALLGMAGVVVGVVLSSVGIRRAANGGPHKGLAIAGLSTCVGVLVLIVLLSILDA